MSDDARNRIRDTLAEYCQTIDDGRFDEFAECFTKDAVVAVMGQHIEGRDAIRAWMAQAMPAEKRGRHVNVNIRIEVLDAERATAASDFLFVANGKGEWKVTQVGRYVDDLLHDDGRWRLARREIRLGAGNDSADE